MNYLKKIFFIFQEEQLHNARISLCERLAQSNMLCQNISESNLNSVLRDARKEEQGLLWLTDQADLARKLIAEEQAVLACVSAASSFSEFQGIPYLCQEPEELEIAYLEGVYRRYQNIPWEICETNRCILRETCVLDVAPFYEIYKDPAITEYMENLFEDFQEEIAYTKNYIKNVYEIYEFGIWTVVLKETGEIIGRAGLSYREGFEEPELGFVIGTKWQKKGLAYEVCQAILHYGERQLGFTRMLAFVEPENKASLALCNKLGFQEQQKLWIQGISYVKLVREV